MTTAELTAVSSLALVVVTSAYVWLTWKLARNSAESVKAAKDAAAHAAAAVDMYKATVPVDLEVAIIPNDPRSPYPPEAERVVVKSLKPTVFVHELQVEFAGLPSVPERGSWEMDSSLTGRYLTPAGGTGTPLPVLLHEGEDVAFEWPGPNLNPRDPLTRIEVLVHYSYSGNAKETRVRHVTARFTKGDDDEGFPAWGPPGEFRWVDFDEE